MFRFAGKKIVDIAVRGVESSRAAYRAAYDTKER